MVFTAIDFRLQPYLIYVVYQPRRRSLLRRINLLGLMYLLTGLGILHVGGRR